jgi:hypothetical protein
MTFTGTNYKSKVVDTSVSVGDILNFEKNSITQTYRVWKYAVSPPTNIIGVQLPYGLDRAIDDTTPQAVLPPIGTPFPDTSPSSARWQTYALCRSHSAGKQDMIMDVRVVYDTHYHWLDNPKGNNGGTVSTIADGVYLPSRAIYSVKTRQTNLWRAVGTAPSATSDSVTMSTGAYVGTGSTPIKADVACVSIRVQLIVDAESQPNTTTATTIAAYIGKRNSDVFLGYPIGSLVCVGGSLSHLDGEFYTVSLEYEYDEYFEHNQVCATDASGKISLTTGNPTTVYWKRPTRSSVAFNNLWGASAQGYLWRYMAENGRWW